MKLRCESQISFGNRPYISSKARQIRYEEENTLYSKETCYVYGSSKAGTRVL